MKTSFPWGHKTNWRTKEVGQHKGDFAGIRTRQHRIEFNIHSHLLPGTSKSAAEKFDRMPKLWPEKNVAKRR
jgi:hypothetical protein